MSKEIAHIIDELSKKAEGLPEEERNKLGKKPDQLKKRLAIASVIHHAKLRQTVYIRQSLS